MKSKLNPVFIIVGLFLFKVAFIDNIRFLGHTKSSNYRELASSSPPTNNIMKAIR
jgi:hypothetical protein